MNELLPGFPGIPKRVAPGKKTIGFIVWGRGFLKKIPKRVFHIRFTKATEAYGTGSVGETFAHMMGYDNRQFTMTDRAKEFAKENGVPLIMVSAMEDHNTIKFTVW